MSTTLQRTDDFVDAFQSFQAARVATEPAWLAERRNVAMAAFRSQGIPTTKHEDWRWTSLSQMMQSGLARTETIDLSTLSTSALDAYTFADADTIRLVFVNGHYAALLSWTDDAMSGLTCRRLSDAVAGGDAFVLEKLATIAPVDSRAFAALNTAFLGDGVVIDVADGAEIGVPVHVVHLTTTPEGPTLAHPRMLVRCGRDARVTILETHAGLGDDAYLTNPVSEIFCEPRSEVLHVRLLRDSDVAYHIGVSAIDVGTEATYTAHAFTSSGLLVRNEGHAKLSGEGAHATLNGLYLSQGEQVVDNHTRIDHAVPHCTSWQMFKGILDGASRGVFDGKIHVYVDAQKTDAKQTSRNLLLSDDAVSNNKPQLEIYADDVKCTHGATTGELDDDQLFYLRARGLSPEAARSLLTHAFARELIDQIEIDGVREAVEREFAKGLPNGEAIHQAR